ncbi:MAG: hypothetical protein IT581_00940 [Verrucomicrobiales bacterium]|nr:hypothetical protein [Verrucomicrobiales bacterium]
MNSGDFAAALALAERGIQLKPLLVDARMLLFELLCLSGDWARAAEQLEVVARRDGSWILAAGTFRHLLAGERVRSAVMSGTVPPAFLGDADPANDTLAKLLGLARDGEANAVAQALQGLRASRKPMVARLNGAAMADWGDTDDRFSDVIEVILPEGYFWVPVKRVKSLTCEEPAGLTDLIWVGSNITLTDGKTLRGYLPGRYPSSESSMDSAIRMGWKTTWQEGPGGIQTGAGQRIFWTADPEVQFSILDIRTLEVGA